MSKAYKALCGSAIIIAGGLLGLQILGALEYTQGGSTYTRASMIAAMVTLAALPIFIEAARRIGARGVAWALFLAFLSFLAYSLPANVGRTGEIKQAKVAEAAAVSRIRDDLERTSKTLEYAQPDMISECGTGEGKRCRAKRNTVQALEARKAMLETNLVAAEKSSPGDVGSETLSWGTAGMVPAANIRKLGIIGFALGLDIAIWALIWFATHVVSSHSAPVPRDTEAVLPPVEAAEEGPDNVTDWCHHFRAKHGRQPSIPEVQAAFPTVPKTTAWRRAKAA